MNVQIVRGGRVYYRFQRKRKFLFWYEYVPVSEIQGKIAPLWTRIAGWEIYGLPDKVEVVREGVVVTYGNKKVFLQLDLVAHRTILRNEWEITKLMKRASL